MHRPCRPAAAGIGLGQNLGGHVARAAAEVLHLDAVLLLEGGVDGIDDLGIEARIEDDLAFGLGLVEVDLARPRRAGALPPPRPVSAATPCLPRRP